VILLLPASVTATGTLAGASTVVTEFGTVIVIVLGMAFGIWGVKFLISRIKGSRG